MKKRKGFTYIEAILAITLVATATVFRTEFEAEKAQFEKADSLGKDMAKILGGIDKRILHDGRANQKINSSTGAVTKGSWDANWGSNSAVVEQMLKEELIGYNNGVCGDSTNGWRPTLPENNEKALVDCNILAGGLPFNFEIRGERNSLGGVNSHIIREWNVKLYHANDADFVDNFKFYSEIIKSAKLNDTIRMTGAHDVVLINRGVSPEVELNGLSECYSERSNCAILFRYKNSNTAESTDDAHVRTDGSVGMINDLTFKTTAGTPEKCFKYDDTEVSCGFDYDIANGSVDLYSNEVNATTFHLLHEQLPRGTTPVTVMCDEGSSADSKVCGISVIEESGSVIAQAHFDRLYATEVYLNKFETNNPITIRQSLDNNISAFNNTMTFSRSGLTYTDSTYGEQMIEFGNDLTLQAVSNALNLNAKKLDMRASGAVNIESTNTSTNIADIEKTKVEFTTQSGLTVNGEQVLTKGEALQGVRIISIDNVNSGSTIAKKDCPYVNSGSRPTIDAIAYPANGHDTNITSMGDYCDVTSTEFVDFYVSAPRVRLWRNAWNGGGEITNGDWTSADEITAESTYKMTLKCDPQRDNAISYQLDSSGSYWKPRFWFWGGSQFVELTSGDSVPMTVVQYCDYAQ